MRRVNEGFVQSTIIAMCKLCCIPILANMKNNYDNIKKGTFDNNNNNNIITFVINNTVDNLFSR